LRRSCCHRAREQQPGTCIIACAAAHDASADWGCLHCRAARGWLHGPRVHAARDAVGTRLAHAAASRFAWRTARALLTPAPCTRSRRGAAEAAAALALPLTHAASPALSQPARPLRSLCRQPGW
jgi:hypothetical protein